MKPIPLSDLPDGQAAILENDIIVKCPKEYMRPLFCVTDTEIVRMVVSVIGEWNSETGATLFHTPATVHHKDPRTEVQPLELN